MSKIEILTPDHDSTLDFIQKLKGETPKHLDVALQKACALLEATLKTLVLQETHGTGLTAASIETRKEEELTYGVGSYTRGHILRFLDQGTGLYRTGRHIVITPIAKRALHFFVKETGDEVFAMYCLVKGILPFEFLSRAIQTHLEDIDEIVKQETGGM